MYQTINLQIPTRVLSYFNFSCSAKDTRTRAIIRLIIQHRQGYPHQYSKKDDPDNLVDNVGERRVCITMVEDGAAGMDIARTNLLATTKKNHPRSIR
jgi:hypothetical protein